jgi:hypothetical protein
MIDNLHPIELEDRNGGKYTLHLSPETKLYLQYNHGMQYSNSMYVKDVWVTNGTIGYPTFCEKEIPVSYYDGKLITDVLKKLTTVIQFNTKFTSMLNE